MLKVCLTFLSLSLIANSFLYFLYKNEKTEKQALFKETQNLKTQLIQITDEHTKLKNLCELDKRKIEHRYKTLLQKAMQKPKTVEVPIVIEKHVFVSNEDCQKMGAMIDEALNLVNNK